VSGLQRLAHVAFTSPDPERLAAGYGAQVGLVASGTEPLRLTTNGYDHCLEIHEGPAGLHHIAFEVRDVGEFEGTAVESPGYDAAIEFADPEGNTVRFVSGAHASEAIDAGDRGFRPKKIGHVGVRARDPKAQIAFYETLGFKLSDWIGDRVGFLRVNPDHHVLVFVASEGQGVHHVAYEVGSFEDFARQADLLAATGVRVLWGPGRHAPSRNYFMYFDDVDGNRIEWVNSIKQIPDDGTYVPEVYDPAVPTTWNVWGPQPPPDFV
jgi:catechol 2,3-dioxygenase-like lactoylglutathione lyase family enzyme